MKKPDLEQFVLSVKAVKFLLSIIFICYCILYLKDLYGLYLHNKSYLDNIFNLSFIEKHFRGFIDIFLDIASVSFIFLLKAVALSILLYLLNRIPVPKRLLGYWHQDKQIDTILGKMLTQHFRRNSSCNILNFLILCHNKKVQKYFLIKNAKNAHLLGLFKSFDKDFVEDYKSPL